MDYPLSGTRALRLYTVPGDPFAAQGMVWPRHGLVLGWALVSADGATAVTAQLHDGADPDGPLIAALSVPATSGLAMAPGLTGFPVQSGAYLTVTAGRLAGTFVIGELW